MFVSQLVMKSFHWSPCQDTLSLSSPPSSGSKRGRVFLPSHTTTAFVAKIASTAEMMADNVGSQQLLQTFRSSAKEPHSEPIFKM